MVQDSIADYSIKSQMQLQEKLLEHHFKIEAQIEIILKVNLQDCDASHLFNYLCVLQGLVNHARDLNEQLLNILIRAAG